MSSEQAHFLARTLPLVTEHPVPGEGHFSLFARYARAIVQSVLVDSNEGDPKDTGA